MPPPTVAAAKSKYGSWSRDPAACCAPGSSQRGFSWSLRWPVTRDMRVERIAKWRKIEKERGPRCSDRSRLGHRVFAPVARYIHGQRNRVGIARLWQKSTQSKGLLHKPCKRLILRCGAGGFACSRPRHARSGILRPGSGSILVSMNGSGGLSLKTIERLCNRHTHDFDAFEIRCADAVGLGQQ